MISLVFCAILALAVGLLLFLILLAGFTGSFDLPLIALALMFLVASWGVGILIGRQARRVIAGKSALPESVMPTYEQSRSLVTFLAFTALVLGIGGIVSTLPARPAAPPTTTLERALDYLLGPYGMSVGSIGIGVVLLV